MYAKEEKKTFAPPHPEVLSIRNKIKNKKQENRELFMLVGFSH
jgi:hypothetical protein